MKKNNKFREKLFKKTDFPKIKTIPKNLNKSWGKGKFVMPSPLEVNTLMKKVTKAFFISFSLSSLHLLKIFFFFLLTQKEQRNIFYTKYL